MGQGRPTDFAGFAGMCMTTAGFATLTVMFGTVGALTGSPVFYVIAAPCAGVAALAAYRAWRA